MSVMLSREKKEKNEICFSKCLKKNLWKKQHYGWIDHKEFVARNNCFINDTNTDQASE